ncbi:hypothetical protein DFH28DRAFT_1120010 [Melampsora americana]|nr:hypothetical protein DFH28DRAFT_1120010 [Melampsora americana]
MDTEQPKCAICSSSLQKGKHHICQRCLEASLKARNSQPQSQSTTSTPCPPAPKIATARAAAQSVARKSISTGSHVHELHQNKSDRDLFCAQAGVLTKKAIFDLWDHSSVSDKYPQPPLEYNAQWFSLAKLGKGKMPPCILHDNKVVGNHLDTTKGKPALDIIFLAQKYYAAHPNLPRPLTSVTATTSNTKRGKQKASEEMMISDCKLDNIYSSDHSCSTVQYSYQSSKATRKKAKSIPSNSTRVTSPPSGRSNFHSHLHHYSPTTTTHLLNSRSCIKSANNTTPTTTTKYPNPIPAPPLNQTFPNHKAAEVFLDGFASDHGFQIGRLSTQNPTSVIFKCSEGDHRDMTQANMRAIEGQTNVDDPPPKTCPFQITSSCLKKDHSIFYLVIKPDKSTHNHGPKENLPKKIRFITSNLTLATSTSHLNLNLYITSRSPHSTHSLMQEMQSLPTNTQAYLLNSFLQDCQLAKGITHLSITQFSSTRMTNSNKSKTNSNPSITNSKRLISTEDLLIHQPVIPKSKSDSAASTIDQETEADNIPLETHNNDPLIDPTLDKATLDEPKYPNSPQTNYSSPLPKFDIGQILEPDKQDHHQKVKDKALQAVEEALEALEHDLVPPKLTHAEVNIPRPDTPVTPLNARAEPPVALPNSLTEGTKPRQNGKKRKGPKTQRSPSIIDGLTPVAPPAPITRGRKRRLPKGWVYSAINKVENPTVESPQKKPLPNTKTLKPAPAVPPQELQPGFKHLQQPKHK